MKKKINRSNVTIPVREKVVNTLELPRDLLLGEPMLTVTGQRELYLSNYKGILEYGDSFLKIQTKTCRLLISGTSLAVDYYTSEEMKITGWISGIQYES